MFLIFVTGGRPTSLSVSPLQFQRIPYLMILVDPPPPPLIHDMVNSINTVVAYLVVCYAVRTAQVTAVSEKKSNVPVKIIL